MTRTFDDLLPTPLDADHLAALAPLSDSNDLLALLDRWVERGWLRSLDRAFTGFLRDRAPEVHHALVAYRREVDVAERGVRDGRQRERERSVRHARGVDLALLDVAHPVQHNRARRHR